MKKYLFTIIFIIVIITVTIKLYAVAIGGADALRNQTNSRRGGMGGGFGFGGRGMRVLERPSKAERLAAVTELEKQVVALKAVIEQGPYEDPNIAALEGANLTKFMDTFTIESNVINNIQETLSSLSGTTGGGNRGGFGFGARGGDLTSGVISELLTLAKEDNAEGLTARLEVLAKEAEAAASRRGGFGGGGGMGGESIQGDFEWVD